MLLYYFQCSDGLHLTQGGNRIVFEEVIAKLREAGLSLETLPVDLPRFDQIDYNDLVKAFEYWTHRRWSSISFQIRIILYAIWITTSELGFYSFGHVLFVNIVVFFKRNWYSPIPKTFFLFWIPTLQGRHHYSSRYVIFKNYSTLLFFLNAMM